MKCRLTEKGLPTGLLRTPLQRTGQNLLAIVEERVKAGAVASGNRRRGKGERWWQFIGDQGRNFYAAIDSLDRVLVRSLTSKNFCFSFLPALADDLHRGADSLPGHDIWRPSASLQAESPRGLGAHFFGTTLEDRCTNATTPSDCFETFPFPDDWENLPTLEVRRDTSYYELRADPHGSERRGHDQDLQPLPQPQGAQPRDRRASDAAHVHGPSRTRRLRLDGHPHRLRLPARLRDRRGNLGTKEEAVPVPLVERYSRRGSLTADCIEREAGRD